MKYNNYC